MYKHIYIYIYVEYQVNLKVQCELFSRPAIFDQVILGANRFLCANIRDEINWNVECRDGWNSHADYSVCNERILSDRISIKHQYCPSQMLLARAGK